MSPVTEGVFYWFVNAPVFPFLFIHLGIGKSLQAAGCI